MDTTSLRQRLQAFGLAAALLSTPGLLGCSGDQGEEALPPAPGGTAAAFDLDSTLSDAASFYDLPFPSDLRLDAEGRPDLAGFPNPGRKPVVRKLIENASERRGWPMVPTAYFAFGAALAPRDLEAVIAASPSAPLQLIDIDPASPERGQRIPVVAGLVKKDGFVADRAVSLLSISARAGFVLAPKRSYAFVVRRDLKDASGALLGIPEGLWTLAHGRTPTGTRGAAAAKLHAPLWETLSKFPGTSAEEVAAAAVFTTGDVVADLSELTTKLVQRHPVELRELAPFGADQGARDGFCELHGKVTLPKFQKGTPPFGNVGDGLFVAGADGLPVVQGSYDEVPVVVTLPRGEMPAGGFPLLTYFHGSGGTSDAAANRGTFVKDANGEWHSTPGKGPAWVVAPVGLATLAFALPVNPERLDGASEFAYLNLGNPPAFRDTFRQGVTEGRIVMEAARTLRITLTEAQKQGCGLSLPSGESAFRFREDALFAQGQSMGGMYTNLVGATEPRVKVAVPTGAGGLWSYFVLTTPKIPGQQLLPSLLGSGEPLTWHHPSLTLLEMAWEPAEPYVFMPRLAKRPLPGHPVRPTYEPAGIEDSYFPTTTYDGAALAYGHRQAGEEVWPQMQAALALDGRSGLATWPVSDNLQSLAGGSYTGVVAQFRDPTGFDGHALYAQVDGVKRQIRCFYASFLKTGRAVAVAPTTLADPCP